MTLRTRTAAAALGTAALLVALAGAGTAYQRPGRTERITVGHDGSEPDKVTFEADMSADGRFVAFGSQATNLVPGDGNEVEDIFVRDRLGGRNQRVSVSSAGDEGDKTSFHAAMTPEGRFVAFTSHATNLVPNDTNGATDVFVHDRTTGTTERVSVSSAGIQTDRRAFDPAISADGRFVAFISGAKNLDPPDNNGECDIQLGNSNGCDVFVHDRVTHRTERVSEGPNGEEGNGPSGWNVDMSADGRYVTFYSWATTFTQSVPGDRNSFSDIFVKDRKTGNIERVSVGSDGAEANAGSLGAVISDDGRFVAFYSIAPNLVPTESDPLWNDVFVHDRLTRTTERVSVSSTGGEGNGHSYLGDISGDGRYVLFQSDATNLVPGDTNGARDAFLHDRLTRATERVAVAEDGSEPDSSSSAATITPDGRLVTFGSAASNLVPGDENGVTDVFVRDRGPALGIGRLHVAASGEALQATGWTGLSGVTIAEAVDPRSDGGPLAPPLGTEIVGAEMVQRAEEGDILFRLRLASLPGVRGRSRAPGIGGLPDVVYRVMFRVGSELYSIRAERNLLLQPLFSLWRCPSSCESIASLKGAIGTTSEEILVSLPPGPVGLGSGGAMTAVRVFAGQGQPEDTYIVLDRVNLGDALVAPPSVTLGIAPVGTAEGDVPFDTAATLADGRFSGGLDVSGLSGDHDVWARVCFAGSCGSSSVQVRLGA